MGTMGYMSPEQVRGLPVDHRSDIFSFGAILYEMLSGKRAFKRDTASDTMAAILQGGAAGADAVGAEHLAGARPHRPALPGEGPGPAVSLGPGHRVRALGDVRRRRRRAARKFGAHRRPAEGRSSSPSRRWSFSPPRRVFFCGGRPRGGGEAGGVKRVAVLPFENLGAARGRLLRRRHRGRGARQADFRAGPRGHRARQLDALQEDDEDAAGDRPRARCPLPADRDRALAEGRRRQPRAGQPRARRDPRVRSAGLQVAAAVRRGDDRRVPGAVGHRDEGGAGAGRRARGGRGEAAVGEADAEPRRLRRLPEGRGGLERAGASDPASLRKALGFYEQAVALDPGFAQAWARVSYANSLSATSTACPTPALARACPAGGGEGRRTCAKPPGGIPGPRQLRTAGHSGLQPCPGAVREGTARCAREAHSSQGDRRLPSRASGAGMRRSSTSSRRSASIPDRS